MLFMEVLNNDIKRYIEQFLTSWMQKDAYIWKKKRQNPKAF